MATTEFIAAIELGSSKITGVAGKKNSVLAGRKGNSVMQNQHQLCLSETGIGERFHITAYQ